MERMVFNGAVPNILTPGFVCNFFPGLTFLPVRREGGKLDGEKSFPYRLRVLPANLFLN